MLLALISKKEKLTPEDRRKARNVIVIYTGRYFFGKQQ
jgi:hypothetical protein